MKNETAFSAKELAINIQAVSSMIADTQKNNGEIPWSNGDKTDPWDMVEAIMGLHIGGYRKEADLGFEWLANNQLGDGSWYAAYRNGTPEDKTHDTNMSSYISVGLLHHYFIHKDIAFIKRMWGTMSSAVNFAVSLQSPSGEIYWAKSAEGVVDPMALLTGSSSVYMSLKCALAISSILGYDMPEWKSSLFKLGNTIKHKRHVFNVTKARYSMDWFYPVLSGALTGDDAQRRIDKHWKKFVVEGLGTRCVSDEPWITIAETSELVLALAAMGNTKLAHIVFSWIQDRFYEDGTYWCGFTFPNMIIWPGEKITWTNAVALMAADALYNISPSSYMFSHRFWETYEHSPLA